MRTRSGLCLVVCAVLTFMCTHAALARPVSGTSSLRLKKPLSNDLSDQVRSAAINSFKIDLWEWMKEEADVTVDTSNAIQRFHFFAFADSCLNKANVDRSMAGHDLTVTIAVPGEDVSAMLEAYNTRCYSISLRFYTLMKKALEDNATTDLYNLGIRTIFYTMGRMGTPIGVSDESTPRSFLLEESRKIMQNFFNKFSVRSQEYIISGKPSTVLASPLAVQAVVDSMPLAGITITGFLPGGKKLCSGITDPNGSVSFADFRIPFVSKGSMLYLRPDFGAVVNGAAPFDAGDLGVTLPEQTLLFNITPATFSISYKVNAVSKLDIPKDFASDAFISKFLRDSCFLAPAQPGGTVDLYFIIESQVSSYAHDELEQTVLKLEDDVAIEDAGHQQLTRKQAVAYEKGYENAVPIPMGLFFWEAASKSTRMIKQMVLGL